MTSSLCRLIEVTLGTLLGRDTIKQVAPMLGYGETSLINLLSDWRLNFQFRPKIGHWYTDRLGGPVHLGIIVEVDGLVVVKAGGGKGECDESCEPRGIGDGRHQERMTAWVLGSRGAELASRRALGSACSK